MKILYLVIMMAFSFSVYAQTSIEYTVQRGETLESIAKKFGVTVDALKQENEDAQLYLYTGMKIVIPQETKSLAPENTYYKESNIPMNGLEKERTSRFYTNSNINNETPSSPSTVNSDDYIKGHFGIVYDAGSFDDIKASGHYGFLTESYYTKGSGFCFSLFLGMDFGLVDYGYSSMLYKFGPNYSVGINGVGSFIIPVYVSYARYTGDEYIKLTGHHHVWGWAINPKINIGILQIGLQFSGSFKNGSVVAGFTSGLVF